MSRQLAFTSTVSVMVMALFALSATVKAQVAVPFAPSGQVAATSGR
jgi:hypothetical protein